MLLDTLTTVQWKKTVQNGQFLGLKKLKTNFLINSEEKAISILKNCQKSVKNSNILIYKTKQSFLLLEIFN